MKILNLDCINVYTKKDNVVYNCTTPTQSFWKVLNMQPLLTIIKTYISTASFLILSATIYLFSSSNKLIEKTFEDTLPMHGRFIAFLTILGLVLLYEVGSKNHKKAMVTNAEVRDSINAVSLLVEKRSLISDVNCAYSEFSRSGKSHITGEYYIKEIMALSDIRLKLAVNSYTQNKLDYLVSKIKHE